MNFIISGYFGLYELKDLKELEKIESPTRCSRCFRLGDCYYLISQSEYPLIKYDLDFNVVKRYTNKWFAKVYEIHEAQTCGRLIWVADTGVNDFKVINPKTMRHFSFSPNYYNSDLNHFNSIFFLNEYVYILAHNFNKPSKVYAYLKEDILKNPIVPTPVKIWEFKNGGMHTIGFIPDIGLVAGDSRAGSLVTIKGKELVHIGGYLHGFAFADPYLLLMDNDKEDERNRRNLVQTRIQIYKKEGKKFSHIREIELPEKGGLWFAEQIKLS